MHYKFLPKQKEFLEIPDKRELDVAIYQGGYGSGKTWSGAFLGIALAKKYPASVGLVVAKEYTLLKDTTMVSYFEHLDNMGYINKKDYKYNKTDKIILFKNGSKILFKDAENPEKFKSLNLHWVEVEEASMITDADFKLLLSRLRGTIKPTWNNFTYRFFMHTNPQASKGWIYEKFVEDKRPNYRRILAPTSDNIYLPNHYIQSMKDDYDPEYYRINVLGEDGDYSSGLVIKQFTDENIKKINYCDKLPLHLTCDFNVDPMMWCIAHKDEENVYFFDEIVVENTTTEECIKEFIRRYSNHKDKIIINGDASGDNRSTQSQYTNYATIKNLLVEHGYDEQNIIFHLRDYNPPILSRIAAFNAKVCNSQGIRHLFVDRRCKWLLYNKKNLRFKPGTSIVDTPSIVQISRNRDDKFLGHIFDAASYLTEYYWRIKVNYNSAA